MVGLIPLLAVEVLEDELLTSQKEFTERLYWFLNHRPKLCQPGCQMGRKRKRCKASSIPLAGPPDETDPVPDAG